MAAATRLSAMHLDIADARSIRRSSAASRKRRAGENSVLSRRISQRIKMECPLNACLASTHLAHSPYSARLPRLTRMK